MTLIVRDAEDISKEFESVKELTKQLRQSIPDSLFGPTEELGIAVEAYKIAKMHFGRIAAEQKLKVYLRDIETKSKDYSAVYAQKALLREIEAECDRAIEVLRSLPAARSEAEQELLATIKNQLVDLSGALSDVNCELHLTEALSEYERGSYLASALLSSRVLLYAVDHFCADSGGDSELAAGAGTAELGTENLTKVCESLRNAGAKAKEFFSTDITIFPSSSDALSLLSDAIELLSLLNKPRERVKEPQGE
ncbi:MAG: hypothetical protein JW945_07790 [Methanomicrobia archaeon]|nr:hypothetical protein [Methanomicrobia archaeon]